MTTEHAFAYGVLAGGLTAAAAGLAVYAASQQLAIVRHLRAHPEERARLRWPWRRLRRRTLGERG